MADDSRQSSQFPPPGASTAKSALWIVGIVVIYFATARLSMLLEFQPGDIAVIWPCTGIFLSAILLTRRNLRPWLVGFLFAADLATRLLAGTPLLVGAIHSLSLAGDAALSAWLLIHFVGEPIAFRRVREVGCWLAFSIVFSNALMSLPASAASGLLPGTLPFWRSWLLRTASDGAGNLLVTPFILSWVGWASAKSIHRDPRRTFEGAILFGGITLLSCILFFSRLCEHRLFALFLSYAILPFLLWAALRFEIRGVVAVMTIVAVVGIPCIAAGRVPAFSHAPCQLDDVIVFQLYLAAMTLPALFLVAAMIERMRAERTSRESETKFRSLYESMNEGVALHEVLYDRSGEAVDYVLLAVNPAFETITGLKATQILGGKASSAYGTEAAPYLDVYAQVAATGRPAQFDSIFNPMGKTFHISVFSPARGQFATVFADITERKRAEEQIRNALDYVRTIFEKSPIGISTWKANGEMVSANSALAQMTGGTIEQLKEQNFRRLESWKKPGMLSAAEEALASGRDKTLDIHSFTTFGKEIWCSCVFAPFQHDGEQHLLLMMKDITERKQAELYHQLANTIIGILNETNEFKDAIRRILVATKEVIGCDVVGMRLRNGDDFPYFDETGFSTDFLAVENTLVARDRRGDVCRDRDGKVSLECTCGLVISGKTDPSNPLFTPGGSCWTNDSFPLLDLPAEQDPRLHPRNRCIHEGYSSVALIPIHAKTEIVGLLQINDRKKNRFTRYAIEALEGIASHIGEALMRRQAEAEREKLQAQLNTVQKMESIGRLAGGVAHDFNNLLMGIMGYVELCRDQLDPQHPLRKYLDEIATSAQRSAAITRQLLAFARKQTIAPMVLNLNSAIPNMLKLLQHLLGEDIDLAWIPGVGAAMVKMDPSQLDQILTNLTINARDAINGVGKVTIETGHVGIDKTFCNEHPGSTPGSYVMLTVSDNGCGMDATVLEHVFEPFFTTKGLGTGLGLATVYGIVKQNDGFVTVYSEPGKGTTLRIYLHSCDDMAAAPTTDKPAAAVSGGTERIMVVEDEKTIRVIVRNFLETLGYVVMVAETPEQALRLAAEQPSRIDLLLTDVVMPGMSGSDLASLLAKQRPEMKCIFMSGYPASVVAHHGVLDTDVNFLHKPFTRDQVALKVRAVLDKR